MRRRLATVAAAAAVAAVLAPTSPATAVDTAALADAAYAAVLAEGQALIARGNADTPTSRVRYTTHRAELRVVRVHTAGPHAVLLATVAESVGMVGVAGNTGVPESTDSWGEVRFSFRRDGRGAWVLTGVTRLGKA